jgi:hypothetical protein
LIFDVSNFVLGSPIDRGSGGEESVVRSVGKNIGVGVFKESGGGDFELGQVLFLEFFEGHIGELVDVLSVGSVVLFVVLVDFLHVLNEGSSASSFSSGAVASFKFSFLLHFEVFPVSVEVVNIVVIVIIIVVGAVSLITKLIFVLNRSS